MNARNYMILKYLKETGEYVTSETLSALCNVSTKTIRKDIHSINDDMRISNNCIEVKQSHGMKLIINDFDDFMNLCNSYHSICDFFVLGVTEREDWIQKFLIESNDWVKAKILCEMLYISPSVLSQNLKTIRQALKKYDLSLVQKPHYGMKIEGREFNKRLCLSEIYISYIDQREEFPGTQLNEEDLHLILQIKNIVDDCLVQFEISMSQVSVQNFIIDIFILLKRVRQGISLKTTEKMMIDVSRWKDSIVAVALAKQIYEQLGIELKDQEIVSISIHLASKRIIRKFDESVHSIIEDFDVNQIVDYMIDMILSKWQIDFHEDHELKSQLALHLIPLEVRSRYNIILQNPLIEKIKQQNILAYHLSVVACKHLVDYHGNCLSDEEIGYIALHIHLALLRKQIRDKKTVLVMCGVGRGTAHTLAYQIKDMYGKAIHKIKTTDYISLKTYDFADVNLLISSIPIKYELPVSKIEVNYFLNEDDKKRIGSFLNDQKEFNMSDYLEDNMIIRNIKAGTKEEAIRFMLNHLLHHECMVKELLENDRVANYELDNMIAILSSHTNNHPQTKVIIGILAKPILWNKKKVQLIIVLLIAEKINVEIIELYKTLSCLAQNPIYIKRIIKKQTYEEIIKVFKEIENTIE